jgi:hypothetical protein
MSPGFRPARPLPLLLATLITIPGCGPDVTEMVTMRDGVRLATEIHLPPGEGPWPTLLYRTPYSRQVHRSDASWLNNAGVAMVAQDTRGRFDSEGRDRVFTTDGDGALKDGYDTCAWIVEQEWSDGLIGSSGGSGLGIVQYMQASAAPPGLVVVNPKQATPNLYSDAIFQGGVRRYALSHDWLEWQDSLHFEGELARHPFEDEFWDPVQTSDRFAHVQAAGLHLGGWFDIFQNGTLEGFSGYQYSGGEGAAGQQKLVIGPWDHNHFGETTQGELMFPENAGRGPHFEAFDALFAHHLRVAVPGVGLSPDDIPTVQYYMMGDVDDPDAPGNEWRSADDWPPTAEPTAYYLQPGGGLSPVVPSTKGGSTDYLFEPWNPSPTLCGANVILDAGPCDQRPVEARADVLVFDTGVLAEPLEIVGRVRAHLFVDIDRPDADLMVRMTDVYPDGRSMLMADGAYRLATRGATTSLAPLETGEIVEGIVDLWSTALVVNRATACASPSRRPTGRDSRSTRAMGCPTRTRWRGRPARSP